MLNIKPSSIRLLKYHFVKYEEDVLLLKTLSSLTTRSSLHECLSAKFSELTWKRIHFEINIFQKTSCL